MVYVSKEMHDKCVFHLILLALSGFTSHSSTAVYF